MHLGRDKNLTSPSALDNIKSKLEVAFLATDTTSRGSKRAESNSFVIALDMLMPSVTPGAERAPPEKAWDTASFSLVDERERYNDSKVEIALKTRTV
jgi:hypothetical protein